MDFFRIVFSNEAYITLFEWLVLAPLFGFLFSWRIFTLLKEFGYKFKTGFKLKCGIYLGSLLMMLFYFFRTLVMLNTIKANL